MKNRLNNAKQFLAHQFSRPRRYFRLRGFGVHSPFAFSFLANAVREKNAYYAYKQINSLSSDSRLQKFLRLIFRIAVVLKIKAVAAYGPHSQLIFKTLSMAGANESENPTLVVALSDANPGVAVKCAENGGTVVLGNIHLPGVNAELFSKIIETIPHGMTFTNGKTAIIAARLDLPKQTFNILL